MEILRIFLQFLEARKSRVEASSVKPVSAWKLARQSYATLKAMRRYRAAHGSKCAWCSTTKKIEIHHIVPVWDNPSLAASESNLFPLCRRCHLVVGHAGSWMERYVPNVVDMCSAKAVRTRDSADASNL